jgi:hypothetical protein
VPDPLACPNCGYVRRPSDTVQLTQCANCGIVFAKYSAARARSHPHTESDTRVDGPIERLTLPGVVVLGAVVALCAFGLWAIVTGASAWDGSDGYGRFPSLLMLLLGGAAFVAAGFVLLLSRSRVLRVLGRLAALLLGSSRP